LTTDSGRERLWMSGAEPYSGEAILAPSRPNEQAEHDDAGRRREKEAMGKFDEKSKRGPPIVLMPVRGRK